jgi:uncharacterized protein
MMDPVKIISRYYEPGSAAYEALLGHGLSVSRKAAAAALNVKHLNPDMEFIREAAMLHDIGIFMTHTPELGCRGELPYICHGYLGKDLLMEMGLPRHARVCENHVGVGITIGDIRKHGLPLPERDMTPETLEEQIICYADKFFSKTPDGPSGEKPLEQIIMGLKPYGEEKVSRFLTWVEIFGC